MNKAKKYAINGGLIGGLALASFNLLEQHSDLNKEKPFNWKEFFLWLAGGAAIGAGIGVALGAAKDYFNSQEEPLNLDELLQAHLLVIRLRKTDPKYQTLRDKSEWLIGRLKDNFGNEIKLPPYRFGSTEQGTALKENFDIDVCLSFKPNTFSSIPEMMYEVFVFLKTLNGANGIRQVRKQKKSIGLLFHVNGRTMKIDVLPYQASNNSKKDHSGYMCVNNGIFESPSRSKTDVQLLSKINITQTQKKILIILKDWKQRAEIPISSHLLQNLILEAHKYNRGNIPRKFVEKIIMVMRFIEENLELIRIPSIENTNNVLTRIPNEKKMEIIKACGEVIDDFEYQPNSILQLIH